MNALIAKPSQTAASADFVKVAVLATQARGDLQALKSVADDPFLPIRVKDAIGALTTPDAFAYRTIGTVYVEQLRHFGVFDRILADGARRIPLRTAIRSTTLVPEATARNEAAPTPLTSMNLAADRLTPRRASGIVVMSNGFVDAGGAPLEAHVERELRRAVIAATDKQFLAGLVAQAATAMSWASSGDTANEVRADIKGALAVLGVTQESRPFIVASGARVRSMSFMLDADERLAWPDLTWAGGSVMGIPVLPTSALADDVVIVIDAARIAADTGVVEIRASAQGSLRMRDFRETADDDETGTVVSLFQSDLVALFAERNFGFAPIDDAATVVLTDLAWGDAT